MSNTNSEALLSPSSSCNTAAAISLRRHLPPATMDPAAPSPRNPNYVPDKGFWTRDASGYANDKDPSFTNSSKLLASGYVSNKDPLYTSSSKPEYRRPREWVANEFDTYVLHSKRQAVEAPIINQESRINNFGSALPWDTPRELLESRINFSGPIPWDTPMEWLANEFHLYLLHRQRQALEAPIINQESRINNFSGSLPWDNPSIFGSSPTDNSSMSKKMVTFNQFQHSYGGFEKLRDGWIKDPRSGWCTYVGGSEKAIIPAESQPSRKGGEPCRKGGEVAASVGSVGINAKRFESYQDVTDALTRPVSSYSLLYEQSSVQKPKRGTKKLANGNGRVRTPMARQESAKKIKSDKRVAKKTAVSQYRRTVSQYRKRVATRLLTNVKSLLATGMFDGMPVRYVSASHEVLPGIIRGVSYVCGCQSCYYAKALNAYEFERHAGCKTNHPNNRICFENGKSVHQVVQELKVTPRTMLFESIQTVAGAPVNQTAFQAWKESFQAATCKPQGIHAEEEPKLG